MEESIIRNRNITFDSYVFFLPERKQKAESMEIFYGRFNEQFKNCRLGDEDEYNTRDIFLTKWPILKKTSKDEAVKKNKSNKTWYHPMDFKS